MGGGEPLGVALFHCFNAGLITDRTCKRLSKQHLHAALTEFWTLVSI